MKTTRVLLAALAVWGVGLVLTGCKNPDETKTTAPTTIDKAADAAPTAPAPDTQKPKDHPAH